MTTRIFAIGLETYQRSNIPPVKFAEADALALVEAWREIDSSVETKLLLSSHATKTATLSILKRFLADVIPGDLVIFFYAGHGHKEGDTNYLTAFDSQLGDLTSTSIPLEEVLSALRKCGSKRILLFIDSCHSGTPISDGMRSIVSEFSTEELRAFCKDSEHHVAFAACKTDEYSWPSNALKHGIWTHYLILALSGNAPAALEKSSLLTGSSLQNYLATQVPLEVKKIRSGGEIQTPCVFGNVTKEYIVADLEGIIKKRKAADANAASILAASYLKREITGKVGRLTGFKKGHRVPDSHHPAAEHFVQNIGTQEVSDLADELHGLIKQVFALKRIDISVSKDTGSASITAPNFRVEIDITQSPVDSAEYSLRTIITSLTPPEIVYDSKFQQVFDGYFDFIAIEFSKKISIIKRIDEIEANAELSKLLSYPSDNSYLILSFPNPALRILLTKESMEISIPGKSEIKPLLHSFQEASKLISISGIKMLGS